METNYWTIIGKEFRSDKDKYTRLIRCRCVCGLEKDVRVYDMSKGHSNHCGCQTKPRKTHGLSGSKVYRIWASMKRRCHSEKEVSYPWYGGKGIKVCKRWQKFENFFEDMGHPPVGFSIDRINSKGNYSPSNCRWANRETQSNNTSRNTHYYYGGKKLTLSQISPLVDVEYSILYKNIHYRGMNIGEAICAGHRRVKKPRKNTTTSGS